MARSIGSSQQELIPRSTFPRIPIDPNHRLVRIADMIDWTVLLEQVEKLRRTKVGRAGRRPHLRALVGSSIFMAVQKMTYRQAEDLIRHYGPARYLCGHIRQVEVDRRAFTEDRLGRQVGEIAAVVFVQQRVGPFARIGLMIEGVRLGGPGEADIRVLRQEMRQRGGAGFLGADDDEVELFHRPACRATAARSRSCPV